MQKILSISISAYNKELYLDRCIQSLIIPSLDLLEIIIVNDGSTDRTSEIAHKYELLYPNSIIVIDKENGHLGSCANASISVATGKYYRLLDADDFFDSIELEKYVHSLITTLTDLVITNHVICGKTNQVIAPKNIKFNEKLNLREFNISTNNNDNCYGMHGTTFRLKLIKDSNIILTEGSKIAECDLLYLIIKHSCDIIFFNYNLYMYQTEVEGQVSSLNDLNQIDQHYIVAKRLVSHHISDISENINIRDNQRVILCRVLAGYYLSYILHFNNIKSEDIRLKEVEHQIKKFDKVLFDRLNNIRCFGIYPIKWYRKTGQTIKWIIPILSVIRRMFK